MRHRLAARAHARQEARTSSPERTAPAIAGSRNARTGKARPPGLLGTVIKTYAIYPEPFWRKNGLNGQAISDAGPVKVTFDNSPPSGKPGVLLGFLEGSEARTWARRSQAERREAVIGSFVRYFGDAAAWPQHYIEKD